MNYAGDKRRLATVSLLCHEAPAGRLPSSSEDSLLPAQMEGETAASRIPGLWIKILLSVFLLALAPSLIFAADFPAKPIKVIVYTGPGGLIDVTARKFADVAAKYTDAVFVVENQTGAGGIVAINSLLRMPSDGYTILACTKSNISKLIQAESEQMINEIDWIAMLMADPECIITKRSADICSWEQVEDDARAKHGTQIWLGPAAGGLDHVMALKVWEKSRINANWIPFKSGGKAIAALLGEQGIAYVGNPRDSLKSPELMVAAVSGSERLPQFPDAPTFRELGIKGLENEFMWRGFAMKKGAPPAILDWYADLFAKVTADPEWRAFWEKGGIDVVYYGPEKFAKIVALDRVEFKRYLQALGIVATPPVSQFAMLSEPNHMLIALGVAVVVNIVVVLGLLIRRRTNHAAEAAVAMFLMSIAVLLGISTFGFPGGEQVGPAVIPRLWMLLLVPLGLAALVAGLDIDPEPSGNRKSTGRVVLFIILLCLYLAAMHFVGYLVSSFVFVILAMLMLGSRAWKTMLAVSVCWLLFSYLVFERLLTVALPKGLLFE